MTLVRVCSFSLTLLEAGVVSNCAPAGVKYYNGDIFVTVPRWKSGVLSTLNKVVLFFYFFPGLLRRLFEEKMGSTCWNHFRV
jgi:hypothetical protein